MLDKDLSNILALDEFKAKKEQQQEILDFHQTDLGNAKFFVKLHGADIRYCNPWRRWLIWDGTRWMLDEANAIYRLAKDAVQQLYRLAAEAQDEDVRKAIARHAMRSESEARIEAMISLARSEEDISITPAVMDADPMVLNVKNGTIDLRTGELRPHRREDLLTKVVDIEYDPNAACPLWDAFLNRIMDGNTNLIKFLQRAAGYTLTGDVSEQCLFICYGTGANGKSVFLRTLLNLLGDHGKQVSKDVLVRRQNGSEEHPTVIADLFGKRLAVTIEADEGSKLDEAKVKWLTGNDKLSGRYMRGDYFDFEPTHKLWFATNHKPIIRGTDNGVWRRIKLIPFTVTIPEAEQDKHLIEKLKDELPGILAWAVRGCLEWQQCGLGTPNEVTQATDEYRAEMDILAAFIEECCLISHTAKAKARELYAAYVEWCEQNGEHPLTQRNFGMRLTERGFQRVKANSICWWVGLGLLYDKEGAPAENEMAF